MGRIIRRTILPVLLMIVGVAAIVEGMWYHPIAVVVKEETTTTVTINIPLPMPPGPSADDPSSPDGPPSFPPGAPTSIKQSVERVDPAVVEMVPEPELMRDVSVGGVTRLASGELKRTYSGNGPALCPS